MTRLVCTVVIGSLCSFMLACQPADRERVSDQTPILGPTATTGQGLDAQFMNDAASSNAAEVELAQLALQRASHPDVRRFAEMMLTDHRQSQDQLVALGRRQNVSINPTLEPHQQSLRDRLAALQGHAFDLAYMAAMVQEHQRAVEKFENQVRNGRDPQVKRYAADSLPDLQHHLQIARDLQARLDSPAAPGTLNHDAHR